ncbi:hypothetical protein L1987_86221 [Smallanthus sonchifolius]|uniref:Uncharacterized protein n=1 Tax=Smallanthus sonchifolius TaxID=185202 RepID=A0ACB8Y2W3_9ASTR|nr:hypothetical protein L1987_86221 [Smallanthus sonchifolius]
MDDHGVGQRGRFIILMDPETVINLYDSWWFNQEILKKNRNVSCAFSKTSKPELKYSSLRSILVRSQSDDVGNSFNYGYFSPNSVLKTIHSGKLDFTPHNDQEQVVEDQESEAPKKDDDQMEIKMMKKKKRRAGGTSKSLSDLEFEELKGFMDMGFVFCEQDSKDSSLVEIIPGLQRLGHEDDGDDDDDGGDDDDGDERRPYLSEAWEDMDRKLKNKEAPIMKWEIPVVGDEVDMKDNLKLWAHIVASYVR